MKKRVFILILPMENSRNLLSIHILFNDIHMRSLHTIDVLCITSSLMALFYVYKNKTCFRNLSQKMSRDAQSIFIYLCYQLHYEYSM